MKKFIMIVCIILALTLTLGMVCMISQRVSSPASSSHRRQRNTTENTPGTEPGFEAVTEPGGESDPEPLYNHHIEMADEYGYQAIRFDFVSFDEEAYSDISSFIGSLVSLCNQFDEVITVVGCQKVWTNGDMEEYYDMSSTFTISPLEIGSNEYYFTPALEFNGYYNSCFPFTFDFIDSVTLYESENPYV